VLTLSNDGPPIPAEHLGHVFDPFFSTKPDGTGLGLSISYSILQGHGGDIRVENLNAGRGVRFTITLPIARGSALSGVTEAVQ
jgi:signal transduction histidine kinase